MGMVYCIFLGSKNGELAGRSHNVGQHVTMLSGPILSTRYTVIVS